MSSLPESPLPPYDATPKSDSATLTPNELFLAAIKEGEPEEALRLLDEEGAELEAISPEGHSALAEAILSNEIELARELIARGASINRKNDRGWTPLFCAVLNRHMAAAAVLLEHGADIHAQEKSGLSPLSCAIEMKNEELESLLRSYQS